MNYKILIVEDNILNLKLFHDLLTIRDYKVIESCDGVDLITKVLTECPDLILMDIQLKGVSGIDLIRQLKNNIKTKLIPVIAITAFTLSKDVDLIMESGCNKYVVKPVGMDDFYKAIEEFLPKK